MGRESLGALDRTDELGDELGRTLATCMWGEGTGLLVGVDRDCDGELLGAAIGKLSGMTNGDELGEVLI